MMTIKRMFSLKILGSTEFLSLPPSPQILYIHLCMRADNDGFISNPSVILRMLRIRSSNLELLKKSGLILSFEGSKAVAIKHWHVHNSIKEELKWNLNNCRQEKMLVTLNDSGEYQLTAPTVTLNDSGEYQLTAPTENQRRDLGISTPSHNENRTNLVSEAKQGEDLSRLLSEDLSRYATCTPNAPVPRSQKVLEMSRESVENKIDIKENYIKEKVLEKESPPSATELKELFDIYFDTTPTFSMERYLQAKKEYDKSEFARKSFKSISILDRHLDRLIAGAYQDFHRSPKREFIHDIMPQTYTQEEIDSVFRNVRDIDIDNWDI